MLPNFRSRPQKRGKSGPQSAIRNHPFKFIIKMKSHCKKIYIISHDIEMILTCVMVLPSTLLIYVAVKSPSTCFCFHGISINCCG